MGGAESNLFFEYKTLLLNGLKAARKQQDRIINIVEIMGSSKCFILLIIHLLVQKHPSQVRNYHVSRTDALLQLGTFEAGFT